MRFFLRLTLVYEPAAHGVGVVDPFRQYDPSGHCPPIPLWAPESVGVAVSTPVSQ